jgi:hypothetical protein
MTKSRLGVCGAVALLTAVAGAVPAKATTIDFATLPGNNDSSFSSYTEGGFTVASTAGTWAVGKIFGNPTPDIFCVSCKPSTVDVTGGQFTFASVDLNTFASPVSYSITGFLNSVQVLAQSGTVSGAAFSTIDSVDTSQVLTSLSISISTSFENGGSVDNIVVNSVPLPAALPLFAGGLGVLGLLGWRGKRKAAAAA